ncbi:hypothetical protein IFM89_034873 [Coptis chinensis]|uniref:FAR1 domain-containing protein n=1 Tax=Coptis chinensis TaxID=261450 RepID=A0A835I311_9MAGN|nr:hypothetical protein IFM89_034873 [Coptis chinensis]
MESSVDEELELDINDQETFDDLEITENEVLEENSDSHAAPNDKLPDGTLSENVQGVEPYVGMEFESRDDAKEYYAAYATHAGFTVRIRHSRRSKLDEAVISQDYVCSKEGFRAKKNTNGKDRVRPPPPVTRAGCHAMLRVTRKEGGKWIITKFVRDHSHSLTSARIPWRCADKTLLSEDEKDKKIRELTIELYNEKRRCERRCIAYQKQLQTVMKYIETHTEHLSSRVQDIVQNIKEVEDE